MRISRFILTRSNPQIFFISYYWKLKAGLVRLPSQALSRVHCLGASWHSGKGPHRRTPKHMSFVSEPKLGKRKVKPFKAYPMPKSSKLFHVRKWLCIKDIYSYGAETRYLYPPYDPINWMLNLFFWRNGCARRCYLFTRNPSDNSLVTLQIGTNLTCCRAAWNFIIGKMNLYLYRPVCLRGPDQIPVLKGAGLF